MCLGICLFVVCVFFFFQAEDGIRDLYVTGVQTCLFRSAVDFVVSLEDLDAYAGRVNRDALRSEERRVGKSVDLGGRRIIKKKKKKKYAKRNRDSRKGPSVESRYRAEAVS